MLSENNITRMGFLNRVRYNIVIMNIDFEKKKLISYYNLLPLNK